MRVQDLMVAGLALTLLGSGVASAQDNAIDMTCKKPQLREQVSVSAEQMNGLIESAQSYLDCMKPLIEAERNEAQKTLQAGKAQAEAANKAVTEVNGFIEAFRAYQSKYKGDK